MKDYRVTVRALVDLIYEVADTTKGDAKAEGAAMAESGELPVDMLCVNIIEVQAKVTPDNS